MLGSHENYVYTGKIAFKLDLCTKLMKNGFQYFSLDNMVQQTRQVEGSPAVPKMAVTKANTIVWDLQGLPGSLSAAKAYHEIINCPNLGYKHNMCSTPQLVPIVVTAHMQIRHLESSKIILKLQVWFTGLLGHGGIFSLVPNQYIYPALGILSGEARYSFASIPYQKSSLYLSLEMTGAPVLGGSPPFYTNHATIAQDGWNCVKPWSQTLSLNQDPVLAPSTSAESVHRQPIYSLKPDRFCNDPLVTTNKNPPAKQAMKGELKLLKLYPT
ncbi:hypothetical protein BDY19DRAFT_910625 [Irpex rosettiformis]|uniref:Uncharacterized protein n=1 Tax=Irpex rosettiformis TaxID=378272 RepID=A0ACB8TMZ5_9APHY|nr:hypothetical protein BDY19DRAFT_910625 [Irpex rosettiformis]